MTSCAAEQAACQQSVRDSIPFWKFKSRKEAQAACDQAYYTCYSQLAEETEQAGIEAQAGQTEAITKIIIITISILVIILMIWLWIKYRK